MKKTPEQTWQAIVERNTKSRVHQAAFTFWRDSYYNRTEDLAEFRNFCRWWDPSWSVPDHVQPILDLYEKYFHSHKVIVTNYQQGVKLHLNPSRTPQVRNWKQWNTWSYTMCVPWDLSAKFDPVVIVYGPDNIDKDHTYNFNQDIEIENYKTIICQPFTRISFASSRFPHGVCASNNRLLWILTDMVYEDLPPHIEPDIKTVILPQEIEKDIIEIIGHRELKHQFMSDLTYFNSFGKRPTEYDWMPPEL